MKKIGNMTYMEIANFAELNSRFFLPAIFAISQIKCAWYQNQRAGINILSRNFEEKYKGKKGSYQQFQIAIRSDRGNIHQTKGFKYEILDKVAARSQKKEHRKLKWSRGRPNFACGRERNNARDKREVKQHCDTTLLRFNHCLYENILQSKKKSRADRNEVKYVKVKIVVGSPSRDNRQSDESDQGRNPSKPSYIFTEDNSGQNQRKQRNRPKNNHDLSQRQLNNGKNVKEETYRAQNSTNDVQEELIRFKRRFALSDYERQQGNQSEKKSEKSYFKGIQSLPHEFRNNIVGATNKHLTEKKRNSLPIPTQSHELSDKKLGYL